MEWLKYFLFKIIQQIQLVMSGLGSKVRKISLSCSKISRDQLVVLIGKISLKNQRMGFAK